MPIDHPIRRVSARQRLLLPLAALTLGIRMAIAAEPAALSVVLFDGDTRSEEHTSELQSLIRNPDAVSCLKTQDITLRIQVSNQLRTRDNTYKTKLLTYTVH